MSVSKVSVAYGSAALAAAPSYTVLDTEAGLHINGWRTKRGRQFLTDRTGAGTASFDFSDTAGVLDPTHAAGPFYPMDPNCPAKIELRNPVSGSYVQVFGGLVQDIPTTVRMTDAPMNQGAVDLADMFSLLALKEVPPGLDFDSSGSGTTTPNTVGDTRYAATDVQSRILAILADAGVPSALYTIFSGNVNVQAIVYSPGYKILAALQDAADAEFPGVANLYCDKTGILTFHGRLARFNSGPGNPYGIQTWKVGDAQAVAADTSKALLAVNGLMIDRDVTKVINNALCTPLNILSADIAGQLVVDAGSITQYGARPYSAQNLHTAGGITDGNDALAETLLFADFYVANMADAQTRVKQAIFKAVPPGRSNAAAHWSFLCNVEIGDVVEITTTHPGGGGLSAEPYFVEGISYQVDNQLTSTPNVTMTLDLSPQAYFTTEPWSDPH